MDDGNTVEAAPSPASRRWPKLVRALAYLAVVSPALIVGASVAGFFPLGLIPAAGFVWVIYSLDSRLRGTEPKRGLALAIWVGLISLVFVVALAYLFRSSIEPWNWKSVLIVVAFALAPLALLGCAIAGFRSAPREPGGGRILAKSLGLGSVYLISIFIPAAVGLPSLMPSRQAANHARAVGSLRTINTAMMNYRKAYQNGFAPSLAALGSPAPGENLQGAGCSAADLISPQLAKGQESGYAFELIPGPTVTHPTAGCPAGLESYAVGARPVKYGEAGILSFFTDQTGVIRSTGEDRAATASDPPRHD